MAYKLECAGNQIKNVQSVVSLNVYVRHFIGYFHDCNASELIVSWVSISMCLLISVCVTVCNVCYMCCVVKHGSYTL